MRKTAILLVCIALMASACANGTGDDTTTTTEEAAPTTAGVPADIERICLTGAAQYGSDGACANYVRDGLVQSRAQSGGSPADLPPSLLDFVVLPPDAPDQDDFCLVVPDHVFVFPDDVENLVLPGLIPVTVEDPGVSEVEISEEFFSYLEEVPLGLYRITDEQPDIFSAIDDVESQNGGLVIASPHYLLTSAPPSWTYGPHGAAQRINGTFANLPTTGPASSDDGTMIIVDTGVVGDAGQLNLRTEENEGPVDPRVAGHGLFAASVARQFNEALTIDVYSADLGGPRPEAAVVDALHRADPSLGAVVSLSIGTYECRDGDPPLSLIQALFELSGVDVAAASGNDGYADLTMWPAQAGFPDSVSGINRDVLETNGIDLDDLSARITAVGSMDRNGVESTWSNRAEVLAPGEDVVGLYSDRSGQTGLAVWSGTSFATPHFAACLASGVCSSP